MRRNVLQEITLFIYIRIRAGAFPNALSSRVSQSEQLHLYTYVSFVHPESFGSRKRKQSTTAKLSPPIWRDRRSGKCHVRSFLRLSLDKLLTKLFNAIQSKHITHICCFYIIRYEECACFWFCIVHRRTSLLLPDRSCLFSRLFLSVDTKVAFFFFVQVTHYTP